MIIDPAKLKALAEQALADDAKATPGPWPRREHTRTVGPFTDHEVALIAEPSLENYEFIFNARSREPQLARAALALAELWPSIQHLDDEWARKSTGSDIDAARYLKAVLDLLDVYRRLRDAGGAP